MNPGENHEQHESVVQTLARYEQRIAELEAQHKRELSAARDAVEFWQDALDKSAERVVKLEAELERYRRIVPGTPATESEWVALVARAEAAERKLNAVKKLPGEWRECVAVEYSRCADELEAALGQSIEKV